MAKNPSSTGQRQLRVGEMIRRNLSEFLSQGAVHDAALNGMSITIGEVRMSPDFKVATVFVMPLLGGAATVADAIAALSKNSYHLRKMVAGAMTLRYAPELRFRADDTFDRLDHARKLFSDPQVQRDIAATDDPGAEPEAG